MAAQPGPAKRDPGLLHSRVAVGGCGLRADHAPRGRIEPMREGPGEPPAARSANQSTTRVIRPDCDTGVGSETNGSVKHWAPTALAISATVLVMAGLPPV